MYTYYPAEISKFSYFKTIFLITLCVFATYYLYNNFDGPFKYLSIELIEYSFFSTVTMIAIQFMEKSLLQIGNDFIIYKNIKYYKKDIKKVFIDKN